MTKSSAETGRRSLFVNPLFTSHIAGLPRRESRHLLALLFEQLSDPVYTVRFDSRDTLYRTPQGAVPAGTPVTIRFRTFHDDVTSVTLRDFNVAQNSEHLVAMKRAASGVSCYQQSLAADSCDY